MSIRVVIGDDAAAMRGSVARLLEAEGMTVVAQAADAEAALAAVERERPDVVVLDVRMPPHHRTDGLDLAERLLAGQPAVGVLLMSAGLNPAFADRLRAAAGPDRGVGYLAKDRLVDIDAFADAVRTVATGGTAFDPELTER